MHGAFPGLRGLGEFAQIGDLGQVEVGQIVDQVCDVGAAGGVGHGRSSGLGEIGDFVSAATLLLIRGIISSNKDTQSPHHLLHRMSDLFHAISAT
jgi:hypothetical protein